MRGKLCAVRVELGLTGITPAGAGKTSFSYHVMRRSRDHPRRCGENSLLPSVRRCKSGSPPQVRGKQWYMRRVNDSTWITPAGAGKTLTTSFWVTSVEDHPRRCGENPTPETQLEKLAGSPPQVRGKPLVPLFASTDTRITPAGAGKTMAE